MPFLRPSWYWSSLLSGEFYITWDNFVLDTCGVFNIFSLTCFFKSRPSQAMFKASAHSAPIASTAPRLPSPARRYEVIKMVHMGYFKYNDAWIGWCPDGQGVVHPQVAAWQYGSGSVIRVWLPGPEITITDKKSSRWQRR